jgi:hypothetical protein
MCTLGAKKLHGHFYIFKNRDLEHPTDTRVIREDGKVKKLLIVDQRGHCEGMNEYGLGIIEATLEPFPRIKHKTPSQIARKILNERSIENALKIIKDSAISANMILSDGTVAYLVEKTPYAFATTKIKEQGVITNLSIKLDKRNGSELASVREYASLRYQRAKEILGKIKSFKGIIAFLGDKKNYPMSICSGEPWWITTKCSFIYDFKRKSIFFCDTAPDKGVFKEYPLAG